MSQCFLIKKYAAGSFTFEDEIFREFVLRYIKSFVKILNLVLFWLILPIIEMNIYKTYIIIVCSLLILEKS